MLKRAFWQGVEAAYAKMALEAPTPAEEFVAHVDTAKDAPPDAESPSSMMLPEDPHAGVGAMTAALPQPT